MWMHQSWSGDLISAVISYLPEGTPPTVLSYWYQKSGGPIFNDCVVPQNLANTVVTHEDYANGNAYLTLSSKGRQLWDDSWTAFRNG